MQSLGLHTLPRVEPAAELSRGGCIVISDVGVLDARVETQLDALARALGLTPQLGTDR
jgi:flagellar biosynthesis/type III secretory pathway protein FliH